MGHPYVTMGGTNQFMQPQFAFDKDATHQLAEVKKGMKRLSLAVFFGAALLATGCGKKADDPAPQPAPAAQPAPAPQPALAPLDPRGLKLAQMFTLNDLENAALGNEAFATEELAMKHFGLSARVAAATLSSDYEANEVAADQKYKTEGLLLVSGKVDAIKKDFSGQPYLSLKGSQMFHSVQAKFNENDAESLASMKKGQSTELVCDISNYIVGNVMLRDCITWRDHVGKVKPAIDAMVDGALSGKTEVSSDTAGVIAKTYAIHQLLPNPSACDAGASEECEAEISALPKAPDSQLKAQAKATYEATLKRMKIKK
jgi:hypothetical protein